MSEQDEARAAIAAAIQEAQPLEHEDDVTSALLIGYSVVCEWAADDGNRWLSKVTADPDGKPLPLWQERGYLHEALFGHWDNAAPEDE